MKVEAWNIDVGMEATSAEDFGQQVLACVEQSWADGADLVLLPEYCWMGAERFLTGEAAGVAEWFWKEFLPRHRSRLLAKQKAVVLGTVPCGAADGRLKNRAPIFADGQELFQDKLALTPWEDLMVGGDTLQVWELGGRRIAVLVCLDVEVPEWSALLRGLGIDLLLVPSATENLMGIERINRCASGRAVELGCAVVVAHLVGSTASSLVDENCGILASYCPSQSWTQDTAREQRTDVRNAGNHRIRIDLPSSLRCHASGEMLETNPAQLSSQSLRATRVHTPQTNSQT